MELMLWVLSLEKPGQLLVNPKGENDNAIGFRLRLSDISC